MVWYVRVKKNKKKNHIYFKTNTTKIMLSIYLVRCKPSLMGGISFCTPFTWYRFAWIWSL